VGRLSSWLAGWRRAYCAWFGHAEPWNKSAGNFARFCPRWGVVLLLSGRVASPPRCPDPRDHAEGCSCRRCYYGVDE
jgi:hypothetical protein